MRSHRYRLTHSCNLTLGREVVTVFSNSPTRVSDAHGPALSGMPRLRGRIHVQNADKPVDEKQRQDQRWDVLQAKQYRSILIVTLAVGAVAAAAALASAWPVVRDWIVAHTGHLPWLKTGSAVPSNPHVIMTSEYHAYVTGAGARRPPKAPLRQRIRVLPPRPPPNPRERAGAFTFPPRSPSAPPRWPHAFS